MSLEVRKVTTRDEAVQNGDAVQTYENLCEPKDGCAWASAEAHDFTVISIAELESKFKKYRLTFRIYRPYTRSSDNDDGRGLYTLGIDIGSNNIRGNLHLSTDENCWIFSKFKKDASLEGNYNQVADLETSLENLCKEMGKDYGEPTLDDEPKLKTTLDIQLNNGNVIEHPDYREYYLPRLWEENTWANADAEDFETVSIPAIINEFSEYNLELRVGYYSPYRNSLKMEAGFDVKQNGISVAELWNDDRESRFFVKMIRPDGSLEELEYLDCDLRTSLKKLCDKLKPKEKSVSLQEALGNGSVVVVGNPETGVSYAPANYHTWANANNDDYETVTLDELNNDYKGQDLQIYLDLLAENGLKKIPSVLRIYRGNIPLGDLCYDGVRSLFVSRIFDGDRILAEESLDCDLRRSLAKLIGKLDVQKKDSPKPIEHRNFIRSVEEILPEKARIEQEFGVGINKYGSEVLVTVNATNRSFKMSRRGGVWECYDVASDTEEYLVDDFDESLKIALKRIETLDRKKSRNQVLDILTKISVAAGVVCSGGAVAFMLLHSSEEKEKTPENPASEFGNWSQRHFVGLPDGEAAAKELESTHAKAIFVITCGQRGDDPKSIVATNYIAYPDDAPIPVQGDTTVSHFEGYEEVLPHPLKVCRNADAGTTWSYPLVKVTQ